jgi:TonB family protein
LVSLGSSAAPTQPSEPTPARSPEAADCGQRPSQRTSAERRRLTLAFLLSLLIHALLLSLTFGDQEFGFPGFAFPWQARWIEAPNLRVVLMPAQVAAAEPAGRSVREPLQQASIGQPVAGGPAPTPSESSAPPPGQTAETIVPEATAKAKPAPDVATAAVPAKASLRTEGSGDAAPTQIPAVAVIAMERSDEPAFMVPPPPPAPTPVTAVAPSASSPEIVMPAPQDAGEVAQKQAEPEVREQAVEVAKPDPSEHEAQRQADPLEAARVNAAQLEAARQEAARAEAARTAAAKFEAQRQEATRQEVARVEAARLKAERQEAARQAAAKLEAQRREATRQEAARIEAARLEAERQEAMRLAAAKQEAQRQEAARQETASVEAARLEAEQQEAARLAAAKPEGQRQEAARQEAARAEAARLEAERQEGARLAAAKLEAQGQEAARQDAARGEAARLEAAHVLAEQEEDARRDARRRAMGRQLEEEAARREAASNSARLPSRLPLSLSTARRVRLWGRGHPNAELADYAEAWARKIQLNTPVDTVREVAKRPHTDPMVTVAVRSDGSVETVTFVLSSGVAEVDEAIRRIVQSHVPYPAFPPGLARQYDVVEIRRTWHFDMAIQLY